MISKTLWFRVALLLAAVVLVPACGDSSDVLTSASPPSGPVTLFAESFDGVFPGTDWTIIAAAGGSAVIDPLAGSPEPVLALSGSKNNDVISVETATVFANPELTISLQLAAPVTDSGIVTVSIVDSTDAVVASAAWDIDAGGDLALDILGTPVTVAAPSADGTYHSLVFSVNGAGDATWSVNGSDELTVATLPAGDLKLRLSMDTGPGGAQVLVDNVLVTTP